jgi:hypothetical protein
VIFDTVYRRLEKDLLTKRKDMAGIVEIANSAFEERDKALERLALLMKQAERERHPKMEDVNDLSAIVENVEETKSTERIQVTI